MAIKINSNGQSLAAQRQVAQTGDSLGRVFERLSSGQRINRASDDAAGLAIVDTLNAKSRVFTAGVRNLNDGISLLSVADAAVSSLTDITVRLKELAEQSANGVYSSKQRQALDNEAQALSKEFTRITQSTTFNGLNLFDGSVQGLRLQAGIGTEGGLASSLGGKKGTGEFEEAQNSPTGYAADLNSDGFIDILSNDVSGEFGVFLNRGDGTFGDRTSVVLASNPTATVIGDLNGDGFADIVSADVYSNEVGIYLGKGDGSFRPRTSLSTENLYFPNALALGDLNDDGVTDLVILNDYSNQIYFGQGDGSFPTTGLVNSGYLLAL